jgi:hypothetical protein
VDEMSSFQLMNVPVFDPMGNMIDTGLKTYQGLNEGISRQLANQAQREKMPFIGKEAEAALQNQLLLNERMASEKEWWGPQKQADLQKTLQDAQKQKMIIEIMRRFLPNGGGAMQGGEGMQGGMPGASGGLGNNSEMGNLMVRNMLGLPAETPEERAYRERETHRENTMFNRNLDVSMGTPTHISQKQKMGLGIEMLLPTLDELKNFDVPNPTVGSLDPRNWDKQKQYDNLVYEAADTIVTARGWANTNESMEKAISMVKRQQGESEKGYKDRITKLQKSMSHIGSLVSPEENRNNEAKTPEQLAIERGFKKVGGKWVRP